MYNRHSNSTGALVLLVGFTGMILISIPIILAIYWVLWNIWLFIMPQLWPTGPEAFIEPGYWVFAGAWFLLTCIGNLFTSIVSSK